MTPKKAMLEKTTIPTANEGGRKLEDKKALDLAVTIEGSVQMKRNGSLDYGASVVGQSSAEKNLVQALREELKKAYLLLDVAKLREESFKEKISSLQQEVTSIKQLIESATCIEKETISNAAPSSIAESQEYRKKISQLEEMIQNTKLSNQFLKEDRDRLDLENIQLKQSLKDAERRFLKLAKVKSRLESNLYVPLRRLQSLLFFRRAYRVKDSS